MLNVSEEIYGASNRNDTEHGGPHVGKTKKSVLYPFFGVSNGAVAGLQRKSRQLRYQMVKNFAD